jgi:hypothetical protein
MIINDIYKGLTVEIGIALGLMVLILLSINFGRSLCGV